MSRIMVNLAKVDTTEIAEQTGIPTEHVERVIGRIVMNHNNNKRQLREPAPEGGITISAAERKYGIPKGTLSRWTQRGYLTVLLRTKNELYLNEVTLANLVSIYQTNPGQGKKTIKKIKEETNEIL